MRIFQLLFLSVATLWLTACSEDYGIEEREPALVVEGWIENGEPPVVLVTTTLPISSEYHSIENYQDFLVKWAKVTVSDGEKSVVLTGKFNKGYYPPYIYTTGYMKGEEGKSYHITVEYENYYATATTTIPKAPKVDSFKVEKVEGSDTLHLIKACFTDDPSEKNYYQFFSRVGTKYSQFLGSYLGSIDDAVLNGPAEIPVYQGHQILGTSYTPYFSDRSVLTIKFAQVDETTFHFWDDYTKDQTLSTNMLLASSVGIRTNVQGGIGYWCGYGCSTYYFFLDNFGE